MNAPVRVSLRVTSGGSALMHEMAPEGRSDDPSSGDDDPIWTYMSPEDKPDQAHTDLVRAK
jgi:hypothetical protein